MDACPTCGARYRSGDACQRCGTQLAEVLAIEAEASGWLSASRSSLRAGDGAAAWSQARRACAVHCTPAARRALALAALATARYRAAWTIWRDLAGDRRPCREESISDAAAP